MQAIQGRTGNIRNFDMTSWPGFKHSDLGITGHTGFLHHRNLLRVPRHPMFLAWRGISSVRTLFMVSLARAWYAIIAASNIALSIGRHRVAIDPRLYGLVRLGFGGNGIARCADIVWKPGLKPALRWLLPWLRLVEQQNGTIFRRCGYLKPLSGHRGDIFRLPHSGHRRQPELCQRTRWLGRLPFQLLCQGSRQPPLGSLRGG